MHNPAVARSICLPVCSFICLLFYVSVYLFDYLSFFLFICVSVYLSVYLSAQLFDYLFIYLTMFICPTVHICVSLSVHVHFEQSICRARLFLHLFVNFAHIAQISVSWYVSFYFCLCVCLYFSFRRLNVVLQIIYVRLFGKRIRTRFVYLRKPIRRR